jgi:hypothetical protein
VHRVGEGPRRPRIVEGDAAPVSDELQVPAVVVLGGAKGPEPDALGQVRPRAFTTVRR